MIAPLIRPIALSGGTFYTFSSAAEDLSFTFNNDTKKFRFSKYALLNLPPIIRPTNDENFIQLDGITGGFQNIQGIDRNRDLAESFQNYCLNLEAVVSSDEKYDRDLDRTVSERVFFKWLKELGAIRYKTASSLESVESLRFTEEEISEKYLKVVQYIGEVDVMNSLKHAENAYSELYVYVPTDHGNTPTVLFKTIDDANYRPNYSWENLADNALNREVIKGRNFSDVHPAGLSIQAHYDSDEQTPTYQRYMNGILNDTWYDAANNAYFTDRVFTETANDTILLSDGTKSVKTVRSRLDGVSIDFDQASYRSFANNSSLRGFRDFNKSPEASSFDFNAVLVYYDVVQPDGAVTTNLYGVLFLDNVDTFSDGGGIIPSLKKYKPNVVTGLGGNSYGFKINFKFDVNVDGNPVEIVVNEYNNMSMTIFMDALDSLKKAAQVLTETSKKQAQFQSKITDLEDLVINQSGYSMIDSRLSELEEQFESSTAVFESNQSMIDLLNSVREEIANIYKNATSVQMAYNLDVIRSGDGINVDRTILNQLQIENVNQGFNLSDDFEVDIANDFVTESNSYRYEVELRKYSNYMRIHNNGYSFTPDRDVVILINDAAIQWKKGQVFRISFKDSVLMSNLLGNFNLYIQTDSLNRVGDTNQAYGAIASIVGFNTFTKSEGTPVLELICIDPINLKFALDILK